MPTLSSETPPSAALEIADPPKAARPKYFPALTGIRWIAALAVFIHHNVRGGFAPQTIIGAIPELHIGVSIFFVLSGFLITYRYYNNYHFTTRWWRDYMVARFARVYPMYCLLTIFSFAVLGHLGNFKLLMANLTLAKGFFSDGRFSGIPQSWSLTVEECFYICAPFMWLLRKRIPLIVQSFLILGSGYLMVRIFKPLDWHGFFIYDHFMLHFTFFGRSFEFVAGMILAIHLVNRPCAWRINFTYLGTAGILGILVVLAQYQFPNQTPPYIYGGSHPIGVRFNNFVLPIFVAMLFYGLIHEETLLRRFLALSWMELLGKCSYVFYLVHLGVINDFLKSSPYTSPALVRLAIFIALSLALYKFVETPINDSIRAWNKKYFRSSSEAA
jgi:peptidoglycan/LPS O-acetylase OafA/YrhL